MTSEPKSAFDVASPFDETIIETLPMTDETSSFAALRKAYELYQDRDNWLDARTRIRILEAFGAKVQSQRDALALQAAREGGKPLVDSIVEVDRAIDGVGVAIKEIGLLTGAEVPMGLTDSSAGRFAHTFREPRGVVFAISAFNHPFNLIIHQVITAIAAGCPVIVKPARTTPLSCRSVVQLLAEAGLPDGWCQMIVCETRVTEKLIADTRVAFMTFIGSPTIGWYLRSKLAPGAACALEHGGAAPVIFDETADIDAGIPILIRGGFYHAGQVCVSVQRIYAHKQIAQEFTEKFVVAAQKLKVGDPTQPDTEVGPIISRRELTRIDEWVQEAIAGGAMLLCGGKKISETVYEPTVLLGAPDDVHLSREEVFGPVVVIYEYDDFDDAIARANAPDLFFHASIFTRNLDAALSASRRLNGMAIMVNDHTAFRVDWMPFGGHGQSGLGLGGIGYSMRDMTIERMVVFRSPGL